MKTIYQVTFGKTSKETKDFTVWRECMAFAKECLDSNVIVTSIKKMEV